MVEGTLAFPLPDLVHHGAHDDDGVRLSSYDLPVAANMKVDWPARELTLSFDYMDEEEGAGLALAADVRAKVGRHSGKIFQLTTSIARGDYNVVMVRDALARIDDALNTRMAGLNRYNQRANNRLIQLLVASNRDQLADLSTR